MLNEKKLKNFLEGEIISCDITKLESDKAIRWECERILERIDARMFNDDSLEPKLSDEQIIEKCTELGMYDDDDFTPHECVNELSDNEDLWDWIQLLLKSSARNALNMRDDSLEQKNERLKEDVERLETALNKQSDRYMEMINTVKKSNTQKFEVEQQNKAYESEIKRLKIAVQIDTSLANTVCEMHQEIEELKGETFYLSTENEYIKGLSKDEFQELKEKMEELEIDSHIK